MKFQNVLKTDKLKINKTIISLVYFKILICYCQFLIESLLVSDLQLYHQNLLLSISYKVNFEVKTNQQE